MRRFGTGFAIAVAAVTLAAPIAAAETTRRQSGRIEEIVVQARKRAELLEETPISVTALGEATLREAGVTRLDEITELVPNLQFLSGRSDQEAAVVIRGIRGEGEIAFDPGVGIYVDGVYLARTQGSIIDIVDVEQVEVLRGPQGTLFGKNTVGGAINITTIKPRDEIEAFAFVRAGNFGAVNTRVSLNLPVAIGTLRDRVFTRLSLSTANTSGYTYNVFRDEYANDRNSIAFLGSVRALLRADLTLDVSGTWARDHTRSRGGQCVVEAEKPLQNLAPGFVESCEASQPFDFLADTAGLADTESYGAWANLVWAAGDGLGLHDIAVRSITSWREQIPRFREDIDMTAIPVVTLSGTEGGPFDGGNGFARQLSQELQLNANAWDDRVSLVGGAFGFWEKAMDDVVTHITLGDSVDAASRAFTSTDNWTWALYGQATVDVLDWLSLTAGLRYTEDKKGISRTNTDLNDPDLPPTVDESASKVFSAWTPMASLAARLPDDWIGSAPIDTLMSYVTWSRGFRGGGFNGTLGNLSGGLLPFLPEHVDNYEWGVKSVAFEGRLLASLSLFYMDYRDIQVTTILTGPDEDGDGVADTIERLVLNAAESTNKGVEFETQARPIDDLQIRGSIGYLDARFDDFEGFNRLTGEPMNRAGETFRQVPKLQTHLSLQYSIAFDPGPAWLSGWVTPRVDWYYQSAVHYQEPEFPALVQRGFNLLHARLSYDFDDDQSQFAVWGKNLTDESYLIWGIQPLGEELGTVARYFAAPRTVGIEISRRF